MGNEAPGEVKFIRCFQCSAFDIVLCMILSRDYVHLQRAVGRLIRRFEAPALGKTHRRTETPVSAKLCALLRYE